jgi:hypothetical protein
MFNRSTIVLFLAAALDTASAHVVTHELRSLWGSGSLLDRMFAPFLLPRSADSLHSDGFNRENSLPGPGGARESFEQFGKERLVDTVRHIPDALAGCGGDIRPTAYFDLHLRIATMVVDGVLGCVICAAASFSPRTKASRSCMLDQSRKCMAGMAFFVSSALFRGWLRSTSS